MISLGIYQHYSGKNYNVIAIARHSETLEPMVVYQSLYDNYGFWVRPLNMFQEEIIINSTSMPRFKFIKAIDLPILK